MGLGGAVSHRIEGKVLLGGKNHQFRAFLIPSSPCEFPQFSSHCLAKATLSSTGDSAVATKVPPRPWWGQGEKFFLCLKPFQVHWEHPEALTLFLQEVLHLGRS